MDPQRRLEVLELSGHRELREAGGHLVFGYTHVAKVEKHACVSLVIRGRPSLLGQQVKLGTVALRELDRERAEAQIVELGRL